MSWRFPYQGLAEPVTVPAAPSEFYEAAWSVPCVLPARAKTSPLESGATVVEPSLFVVPVFDWNLPATDQSQPARGRQDGNQQFPWVAIIPTEVAPDIPWLQPHELPVRRPHQQRESLTAVFETPAPTVPDFSWFAEIVQPTWPKPRTAHAWWSGVTEPSLFVVPGFDTWFRELAVPTRRIPVIKDTFVNQGETPAPPPAPDLPFSSNSQNLLPRFHQIPSWMVGITESTLFAIPEECPEDEHTFYDPLQAIPAIQDWRVRRVLQTFFSHYSIKLAETLFIYRGHATSEPQVWIGDQYAVGVNINSCYQRIDGLIVGTAGDGVVNARFGVSQYEANPVVDITDRTVTVRKANNGVSVGVELTHDGFITVASNTPSEVPPTPATGTITIFPYRDGTDDYLKAVFSDGSVRILAVSSGSIGLPGGTGTQLQYRSSATAFGGVAGTSYVAGTLTLGDFNAGHMSQGTSGNIYEGYGRRISWSTTGAGYNFSAAIGADSGDKLRFQAAGNSFFDVGRVAIYETSPDAMLHILSDGATTQTVIFQAFSFQMVSVFQIQDYSSNVIIDFGSTAAGSEVVFNQQGSNIDFRVEGDTDANMLFVDASTDRVGIGTASPSEKLHVNGNIKCDAIDTGNGAVELEAGTYTPTVTDGTNVSSSTAYECQYLRVGNTVTVSGKIDITVTAALATTDFEITLPIASNLSANGQLAGCATQHDNASSSAGNFAQIEGNATSDRALFRYYSMDSNNQTFFFTFTYRII
ncbi:MAG: hypothetical protein E6Q97_17350 [Desulfurellales bacterium]|nr:MAG: hypothetical protein E6Q97_17350 [Desulfurellales bacterium]